MFARAVLAPLHDGMQPAVGWVGHAAQRPYVRASVCVALVLLGVFSGRLGSLKHVPGLLVLSLAASAPLLTVRRFPRTSIGIVLGASASFVFFGRLLWPMPDVATWLIAITAAPLVLRRGASIVALVFTEAVVLATAIVPHPGSSTPWDATIAEFLAVLLAWTLGTALRARAQTAAERERAAQQVRELQESDASARGRVDIARELHDVVAHHVSLIAVRAATARYSVPDLSPGAERAFDEIAEQARTALTELRTVLGVLRTEDFRREDTPQPTLADVAGLVDDVRAAGATVSLDVTPVDSAPESVQLCAYRIVQEALTNARRYAPGAAVHVEVSAHADALTVRVRDDGGGSPPPEPGSGYGLIGMRERVAMLGGSLRTGRLGSAYQVEAVLPLAAAEVAG